MRKFVSFLLALIVATMLFTTAYGLETVEEETVIWEQKYSELEQLIHLRDMSEKKLSTLGYSSEESELIRNLDIEGLVLERASLSKDRLAALGYSAAEIAILKDYKGERITANSPVLAASATCTGTFVKVSISSSTAIKFKYIFSWSSCPLIQGTDKVGVRWAASNTESDYLACTTSSLSGQVNYYSDLTGAFLYTSYKTPKTSSGFNGRQYSFDVKVPHDDPAEADWVWAKSGNMSIQLEPTANYNQPNPNVVITAVEVYGAVGHKIISGIIDVGISNDGDANSVGITFTPTYSVVAEGEAHYVIPRNGSIVPVP